MVQGKQISKFAIGRNKHHAICVLLFIVATGCMNRTALADIYQWQYVYFQGGYSYGQSTTPCVDGVGVSAVPGADLSSRNLTNAWLVNMNLTGANLSSTNLTDAQLGDATLTDANLSGANIASIGLINSFSQAQLYSTASYVNHNLPGIDASGMNLSGWDLSNQNLDAADFTDATLTGANLSGATLTLSNSLGLQFYLADMTGINLSGANLASIDLSNATLTNANLSGAHISGVRFDRQLAGVNFTGTNLSGVASLSFSFADLTGAIFINANLASVNLSSATLTGADFTGALVASAGFNSAVAHGFTTDRLYSTTSYQNYDLRGIGLANNDLTGWDFSGQNLTRANFFNSTLSSANFSGATLTSAALSSTVARGFTAGQLYTTASYQNHNLRSIKFDHNDLSGWDLAGQDLSFANLLSCNLTNANFSGALLGSATLASANLTNANFSDAYLNSTDLRNANLTGANFSRADLRGAVGFDDALAGTTSNAILPNGTVEGLDLTTGENLKIIDSIVSIHVADEMSMSVGSSLETFVFNTNWSSIISFDPDIPVQLGGDLKLGVNAFANPANLVGDSWRLFDWTGVSPIGTFNIVNSTSGFLWDTSNLYSTGYVTLQIPEPSLIAISVVFLAIHLQRRKRS